MSEAKPYPDLNKSLKYGNMGNSKLSYLLINLSIFI